MSDYLTRLARLAAGTTFDRLTPATVAAARAVTLDTLGAILAGSRLAENARRADVAAERSGSRAATLVGRARKAEPLLAALANGTEGVSLEMDEGNPRGGGHPAIHVLPATLAGAEELGVDGRRFIEAAVAGTVYNTAARRRRPRAAIALPYPLPGPPRRRNRRCSHASAPLSCCCSPS